MSLLRIDALSQNLLINGLKNNPIAQRLPSGTVNLTTNFMYQTLDRWMGRYVGNFDSTPTWEKSGDWSKMLGSFTDANATLEIQQRIESILTWNTVNKNLSLGFKVLSDSCNQVKVTIFYPTAKDDWTSEVEITNKVFDIQVGVESNLVFEKFNVGANSVNGLQVRFTFLNPTILSSSLEHSVSETKLSISDKVQEWSPCGRDMIEELNLCQRYFQSTYNLGVATYSPNSFDGSFRYRNKGTSTGETPFIWRYKVVMRAIPTAQIVSPFTGNTGYMNQDGISNGEKAASVYDIGTDGLTGYNTEAVSNGSVEFAHFVADAEL